MPGTVNPAEAEVFLARKNFNQLYPRIAGLGLDHSLTFLTVYRIMKKAEVSFLYEVFQCPYGKCGGTF
jgi:hypothetical protein